MRRLRSTAQGGGYAAAVLARGVGGRSLRDRPSGVKGRCAIATRRPTAALDPGASAAPVAASQRRAAARRAYPRPPTRTLRSPRPRSANSKSPRFQGIARASARPGCGGGQPTASSPAPGWDATCDSPTNRSRRSCRKPSNPPSSHPRPASPDARAGPADTAGPVGQDRSDHSRHAVSTNGRMRRQLTPPPTANWTAGLRHAAPSTSGTTRPPDRARLTA
jgi:hypothetical protein